MLELKSVQIAEPSSETQVSQEFEKSDESDHLSFLGDRLLALAREKLARITDQNPRLSQEQTDLLNARMASVAEFFVTEKEFFNARGEAVRATPLERIVRGYEPLLEGDSKNTETELDAQSIFAHSEIVLRLALEQHWENPEQYVSHGFDHTLNVVDYSDLILTQNPNILQAIKEKYHISESEARFFVTVVGWFHDFGYPDVGERGKAVHAMAGADIMQSEQLSKLHQALITSSDADTDLLFHDLRDAVLFHSADKVERSFSAKLVTTHGTYLVDSDHIIEVLSHFSRQESTQSGSKRIPLEVFVPNQEVADELRRSLETNSSDLVSGTGTVSQKPQIIVLPESYQGRSIDLSTKKDSLLGAEFQRVDMLTSPLQSVIRVADNCDMSPNRFSETQRTTAFREIYHLLGDPNHEYGRVTQYFERQSQLFKQELNQATTADAVEATTLRFLNELRGNLFEIIERDVQDPAMRLDFLKRVQAIAQVQEVETTWKELVTELIISQHEELSEEIKDKIRKIAGSQNSESLRHFGGCEAIQAVELRDGVVRIVVDTSRYNELNQIQVNEQSIDRTGNIHQATVGVGEYQIWRAAEAYKSITIAGQDVTIQVVDMQGKALN